MGYTCSFLYNETYGTADVNKITERITGSGANPIPLGQNAYATTDLNKITNAITASGVQYNPNCCRVIVNDSTQFKILRGTAFFTDGMAIDVDSSGVLLSIQTGGKNYIYFKKDSVNNTGIPVASLSAPSSDDIPLAEYAAGTLTDKRVYAKSKITGYGNNVTQKITTDLEGTYALSVIHPNWNDVKKIPLIRTDFSRVTLNVNGAGFSGGNTVQGGYFGTIGSNKKVKWSGGGKCDGFEQFIAQGQAVDSLNSYPEPYLWVSGTSYVQIDFDFSETGYVTVRMKTNKARSYKVENLELTLC